MHSPTPASLRSPTLPLQGRVKKTHGFALIASVASFTASGGEA